MAVSRRLRFEILRRDAHTCRYCGASAPDPRRDPTVIVEPFAGPGGWDEGLRMLGRADVLGIELDAAACATRAAAGHRTIRADVVEVPIAPFVGRVEGLIASPPCQQFSQAGNGQARAELEQTAAILRDGHPWWGPDGPSSEGARHILTVGEWIEWTRPAWIALEQVPPVLPLWEAMADWLRDEDYRCWTGILNAADYGVPQTRKRAFLIASHDGPVQPPEPTHARHPQASLFGPERRPWVSMADALGWPETWEAHRLRGAGMTERHGERRGVPASEPAPTVCANGGSNGSPGWVVRTGGGQWTLVPGDQSHRERPGLPRPSDRAGSNAIRLTATEALTLQSFPPDYPIQGGKTKQFEQVGNAVPPLLAAHVLAAVTGAPLLQALETAA